MVRPYSFIQLTPEQSKELEIFLGGGYSQYGLRAQLRAQAVWFSNGGETVVQISRHLRVSSHSIRKWFKIYQKHGLNGLKGKYFYHDTISK